MNDVLGKRYRFNMAWAPAPALIRKRGRGVRWCIDYRALICFSLTIDWKMYWYFGRKHMVFNIWCILAGVNQIRGPEKDNVHHKLRHFECIKMSFRLCNATRTHTKVMNLVLRGLTWKTVLPFLDDILVLGSDFPAHLINLRHVVW